MENPKFRAWDTKRKKMFSAEEMGEDQETLSVDGRGFVNVSGTSTKLSQFHTHLLPLQYTGLKDKNGKEIYEGDIVTADVLWTEPHAMVFPEDIYPLGEFGLDGSDLEVIGNIYENPELLNTSKEKSDG